MRQLGLKVAAILDYSARRSFGTKLAGFTLIFVFSPTKQPYISKSIEQHHISREGLSIRQRKEKPGIYHHTARRPSLLAKSPRPGLRDFVGVCAHRAQLQCFIGWREAGHWTSRGRKRADKTTRKTIGRS